MLILHLQILNRKLKWMVVKKSCHIMKFFLLFRHFSLVVIAVAQISASVVHKATLYQLVTRVTVE